MHLAIESIGVYASQSPETISQCSATRSAVASPVPNSSAAKPVSANPAPQRLWHLDWIRGYAMLLGVPFHVGLIYSYGNAWFVDSPDHSAVVTVLTGWITSFRMPLFFFVAGVLTTVVLRKKPAGRWLWRRLERLGVPLVTATLVISPLIIVSLAYAASGGTADAQFWTVLSELSSAPGVQWVGHLWFLQVLLLYSALALFIVPLIERMRPHLFPTDARGTVMIPLRWIVITAAFVGLYRFGVNGSFFYAREVLGYEGVLWGMLKIEAFIDFLPYFLLGILLAGLPFPPVHRSSSAWALVVLSLFFFADHWNEPTVWDKVIRYACLGVLSVVGSSMILALSSRLVRRTGPWTQFLVGSSFTVYLFHYPFVVWFGTILHSVGIEPLLEYFICVFITLALSFFLHYLLSRSRSLIYLFNGVRAGGSPRLPRFRFVS